MMKTEAQLSRIEIFKREFDGLLIDCVTDDFEPLHRAVNTFNAWLDAAFTTPEIKEALNRDHVEALKTAAAKLEAYGLRDEVQRITRKLNDLCGYTFTRVGPKRVRETQPEPA